MRITIDIDEHLLVYAKQKAAETQGSLKNILEDALREFFSRHAVEHKEIKLETFHNTFAKNVCQFFKVKHEVITCCFG